LGAFCLTTQKDVILCGWENGFQLWNVLTETEISEYSRGSPVNPKDCHRDLTMVDVIPLDGALFVEGSLETTRE
jgi:hypothetical protein